MINELIKLSTHLDNKGYHREANYLDSLIKKAIFEIPDWLRMLAKEAGLIVKLPLLTPLIIENWEQIKSLYKDGEGKEDVIVYLRELADRIDMWGLDDLFEGKESGEQAEENVDPDENFAHDMVDL